MSAVLEYPKQIQLLAQFSELSNLRNFISNAIEQLSKLISEEIDTEAIASDLALAAHEVCANMIDHAYGGEGDHIISATLTVDPAQQQISINLKDNGQAYDPQQLDWPPPDSWRRIEQQSEVVFVLEKVTEPDIFQERGRGVYLLTLLADSVEYRPRKDHNCWRLGKSY